MNIEQAKQTAQDIYNDIFPSAVAYFSVYRETESGNLATQFEARFLICMIAIRLYQEAFANEKPPFDRTKLSRDLMPLVVHSGDQEIQTVFWLMLGLVDVPNFQAAFLREVNQAITVQGKLSLDEEPDSMPQ